MNDNTLGALLLFAIATAFAYYTVWTILLPFLDSSSPVHEWFPSREWAIRGPAFILILGMSSIGIFIGSYASKFGHRFRDSEGVTQPS